MIKKLIFSILVLFIISCSSDTQVSEGFSGYEVVDTIRANKNSMDYIFSHDVIIRIDSFYYGAKQSDKGNIVYIYNKLNCTYK